MLRFAIKRTSSPPPHAETSHLTMPRGSITRSLKYVESLWRPMRTRPNFPRRGSFTTDGIVEGKAQWCVSSFLREDSFSFSSVSFFTQKTASGDTIVFSTVGSRTTATVVPARKKKGGKEDEKEEELEDSKPVKAAKRKRDAVEEKTKRKVKKEEEEEGDDAEASSPKSELVLPDVKRRWSANGPLTPPPRSSPLVKRRRMYQPKK
jgi:hypothetical protein